MSGRDLAIGGARGLVTAGTIGVPVGVTIGNWWLAGMCAVGFFVGVYILWDAAGEGEAS